jgi:hypothetical protein
MIKCTVHYKHNLIQQYNNTPIHQYAIQYTITKYLTNPSLPSSPSPSPQGVTLSGELARAEQAQQRRRHQSRFAFAAAEEEEEVVAPPIVLCCFMLLLLYAAVVD